ncbi:TPA_asm: coat protein [ssRNA phage Esthiorhiza.2_51]|uniref:Coat protein n=2 Tax=Fiersviridae TaxID=2842319 RepID=A0A8S5L1T1_9VIRU|nr:coat protein [ssRNA phage Esthiorhiza.2_51]QDH90700.1 MAG: hypothetical protein H2RhizoLitter8480_000003 [Leviviridae sp.]DAD51560.1 TPA_asm: coat protein [ssRNA phage Esthiorhiza.2_51]
MVQLTSLVLKDHAAADVTFAPRDIVNGVATTVNSTGVPIGEQLASFAVSKTQAGKRKVTMKIVLPVVQDVTYSGVTRPTVVRTAYAELTLTFDGTSSTTERQDLHAALKAMLADTTQIKPLIETLASPY